MTAYTSCGRCGSIIFTDDPKALEAHNGDCPAPDYRTSETA